MSTTSTSNATPLMRKVASMLIRSGSVQVRGLQRTGSRAAMRRFLEREAQQPVSLLHLGETAIFELV